MDNESHECSSAEDINSSFNPPVLILTIIFGFIGNAIALWIFCFHVKSWRPSTVYSLSLAIADTLLICCLPFRADYYIRGKNWIFGDVACRLKIFVIFLNRAESVVFLTVMALNRYFKVIHPHHKVNKMSTRCAVKVALILWFVTLAICVHFLIEPHTFVHNNVTNCEPFNITQPLSSTAFWTNIIFIVFKFILPSSVILFSTCCIIWKLKQMKSDTRLKYKRAVRLVIAVAAVFVICFLPSNVSVVVVLISSSSKDCKLFDVSVQIFYNTLCITYLNSVLDPVVYYFSSSTFKETLKKALISHNVRIFRSGTVHSFQPKEEMQQAVEPQRSSVCNTFDHLQPETTDNI
ncbi:hydroxycarboxylic acid receptor 2-like [Pristis pectinata]|uniref:hydroxycarboxylic acid receptor 2-like n=1 Tax=Pristis pectinata TaxID=685728 RepID=UPI00223D4EB8|nr:hydroxycarboxylic acid receptor 2-like [Pristis pectinata]